MKKSFEEFKKAVTVFFMTESDDYYPGSAKECAAYIVSDEAQEQIEEDYNYYIFCELPEGWTPEYDFEYHYKLCVDNLINLTITHDN